MPLSNVDRQKLHRKKMAEAGFVTCTLFVPEGAIPDLKQMAETMRRHPGLSVARLVDPRTGKLCGIRGPKVTA